MDKFKCIRMMSCKDIGEPFMEAHNKACPCIYVMETSRTIWPKRVYICEYDYAITRPLGYKVVTTWPPNWLPWSYRLNEEANVWTNGL